MNLQTTRNAHQALFEILRRKKKNRSRKNAKFFFPTTVAMAPGDESFKPADVRWREEKIVPMPTQSDEEMTWKLRLIEDFQHCYIQLAHGNTNDEKCYL